MDQRERKIRRNHAYRPIHLRLILGMELLGTGKITSHLDKPA